MNRYQYKSRHCRQVEPRLCLWSRPSAYRLKGQLFVSLPFWQLLPLTYAVYLCQYIKAQTKRQLHSPMLFSRKNLTYSRLMLAVCAWWADLCHITAYLALITWFTRDTRSSTSPFTGFVHLVDHRRWSGGENCRGRGSGKHVCFMCVGPPHRPIR